MIYVFKSRYITRIFGKEVFLALGVCNYFDRLTFKSQKLICCCLLFPNCGHYNVKKPFSRNFCSRHITFMYQRIDPPSLCVIWMAFSSWYFKFLVGNLLKGVLPSLSTFSLESLWYFHYPVTHWNSSRFLWCSLWLFFLNGGYSTTTFRRHPLPFREVSPCSSIWAFTYFILSAKLFAEGFMTLSFNFFRLFILLRGLRFCASVFD